MVVCQQQIDNDISTAFTGEEHQDEKRILAQHVSGIALGWCETNPDAHNFDGLTRAEIRRKKRQGKMALSQHVQEQLDKDRKAAEDNHAVGFLGIATIIITAIIYAVIEFIVTKMLEDYFD